MGNPSDGLGTELAARPLLGDPLRLAVGQLVEGQGTWGATWVAEVIQFTRAPPSSTTFTGFAWPGTVTVVVTGLASS